MYIFAKNSREQFLKVYVQKYGLRVVLEIHH